MDLNLVLYALPLIVCLLAMLLSKTGFIAKRFREDDLLSFTSACGLAVLVWVVAHLLGFIGALVVAIVLLARPALVFDPWLKRVGRSTPPVQSASNSRLVHALVLRVLGAYSLILGSLGIWWRVSAF